MNTNYLQNNLYELRKRAGLSQEDFAEKLGVSRQAVSKWERGEALPDTENLIVISEMFGVTIDELLKSDKIADGGNCGPQEDETECDGDRHFHVNLGNKAKLDIGGQIIVDDIDTKMKIDLDNGEVDVDDDECSVKMNFGGIKVDRSDKVKLNLGNKTVVINDDDDDDDDVPPPKGSIASAFYAVPYPMVVVLAFLGLGLLLDAWYWAWTLFLTIPIYYPLISAIHYKQLTVFPYPVFITFIFCLFGMLFGIWHPLWALYLTIPIYYPVAAAIDRCIKR